MCGIVGVLDQSGLRDRDELLGAMVSMLEVLSARGPDGRKLWFRQGAGLGHSHLRMSDISPSFDQPLEAPGGSSVLAFNGEIYNYLELQQELGALGFVFRSQGDTEVVLAAFQAWGIRQALQRFDGMFALALWEPSPRRLTLARDRLGEKPLYYGWLGSEFVFASELRSVSRHPAYRRELDAQALALYLQHGWVPAPFSIQKGISKLSAGHFLTLELNRGELEIESFWDLTEQMRADSPVLNPREHCQHLHQLLKKAVGRCLRSQVPMGLVLSGGVDSSLVACLAQEQTSRPLPSFTIGFEQAEYDESGHARAIASHLGLPHTQHLLTAAEAGRRVPQLAAIYDEPFGDSCLIATHCLAQMARTQVQGVLSGDGSDELFFGYQRYGRILAGWVHQQLQLESRHNLARAQIRRLLGTAAEGKLSLESLHLRATALGFLDPGEILLAGTQPANLYGERPSGLNHPALLLQYWDLRHYLNGDILNIVDMGTMAAGLEARAPFLSREVVDYVLSLPPQLGNRKLLLRRLLSQYLPPALFERPKQGFCVPIGAWLRGSLRAWAEDLLSVRRLKRQALFRPERVEKLWREFLGSGQHALKLWVLIIFQQWWGD
ncbi:asparagine synthase (glutamine-hydrolyzing) [bacterium]|nr:asparagine synthase (glutamine-hydrolyzing) [bacterium]